MIEGKNWRISQDSRTQNHGKAVATGFQENSTEQEVEQLLSETIVGIGMSTENVKIKCPAKPITHAFIQFNDNNERRYVRRKFSPQKGWAALNAAFTRDTTSFSHRSP